MPVYHHYWYIVLHKAQHGLREGKGFSLPWLKRALHFLTISQNLVYIGVAVIALCFRSGCSSFSWQIWDTAKTQRSPSSILPTTSGARCQQPLLTCTANINYPTFKAKLYNLTSFGRHFDLRLYALALKRLFLSAVFNTIARHSHFGERQIFLC